MADSQQFHYIIAPTLEIRCEPNPKAEVISQALFSEEVHLLDEHESWFKIKTLVDGYAGWAKKEGICSRTTPYFSELSFTYVRTCRLATHLYEAADTIYGPLLTIPFESHLAILDYTEGDSRWLQVILPDSRLAYVQRGDVNAVFSKMNDQEACVFSRFFLGLPYTWGGRSSFGYDCSGFVQMLYRQMGVFLPRDSKDQFTSLEFVDSTIESLEPGDLIFFGFSKDKIRHVGFCLGEGKFIHTSAVTENMPYIRISHIKDVAWNGSGYYPFLAGRKRKTGERKK